MVLWPGKTPLEWCSTRSCNNLKTGARFAMGYIDAHVHVWSADTKRYPRAGEVLCPPNAPASFTPEELLRHARPAGVERINLIQISFYGFHNPCLLHPIPHQP